MMPVPKTIRSHAFLCTFFLDFIDKLTKSSISCVFREVI